MGSRRIRTSSSGPATNREGERSVGRPVFDGGEGIRRGGGGARSRRRRGRWRRWLIGIAVVLGCMGWWILPNVPSPRFLDRGWPEPGPGWQPWRPLYRGVDYARSSRNDPRPMKCHALRIDLEAEGLEVLVNPGADDGAGGAWSQYATTFLRRHALQVAVSAAAFQPFVRLPGRRVEVVGLSISDGHCWSPPVPNLESLAIGRDRRARLVSPGVTPPDAWQGVGGNLRILRGGTNVAERLMPEPTSVAGVSADGRWLYWLIVDGRQPGWSEGAKAAEAAEMMRELGAYEALRMDGGSVVTLAMAGRVWGARVINRPSHPIWSGVQRPIGSLLGIRARPLE